MNSIFNFIYQYRVTALFLFLQALCILMIVSSNRFYNATFFNSSNRISGSVNQFTQNSADFLELDEINARLAEENAFLRKQLAALNYEKIEKSAEQSDFEVIHAKVINKTYLRSANFLTLSLGTADSVKSGMGVIGSNGIVGRVRSVSKHFSTVISVLHPSVMVSSQVKRTGTLCRVQWETNDPLRINIKDVPRHIPLFEGDTIVTSSYNGVFPPGVLIGVIDELDLPRESPFYQATARLSEDFSSLSFAYVIKNNTLIEKDSVEAVLLEEL